MKANHFWGIEYAKEPYYQIVLVRTCIERAMNNSVRSAVFFKFSETSVISHVNGCNLFCVWAAIHFQSSNPTGIILRRSIKM